MKSNEERVKSIIGKAKRYKNARAKVISGLALSLCAVFAITTHLTLNSDFKNKNQESNLKENQHLIVATNDKKEIQLPTFESKEELVNVLKEMAKRNESSFTDRFFGDVVFNDSAIVTTDTAMGMVKQEMAEEAPTTQSTAKGDTDYSETNTQVQGVDESDIVKTNGKNIFYLSSKDDILRIFDSESSKIKLVHEIKLGKGIYGSQMFLDDKYIIVLATGSISNDAISEKVYAYRNCTKVMIYDINTYELVREIETEGNVVSSRKVGEDIYIVTNKYISFYNFDEDNVLPLYKDSLACSGEYLEIPATRVKYFEDFKDVDECSYMIVTSFSLSNMSSDVNINTYLGAGNEIYCSKENLYVAKVNYEYDNTVSRIAGLFIDAVSSNDNSTTSIHKFSINDGDIKYVATGKVSGRLLNQFSMDEYDGYFRITTTNDSAGNNLFVLNKTLEQIGSVENLASGEKIYATRFMGDKAYVVTYKTVDPLFVIDLSNPEKPTVLGELKIPGYSSYLHPLGDNYLIGFGEDSVEKSYLNWEGKLETVAYATGLKMAIFDVSDYNNPKEIHSIKIGGRGSYSELLHNHKVLLFNEDEEFIAFPASLTSEAGNYDNGVPMYGDTIFNGALVYNINVEDGISLRGKISHGTDGKYNNCIERIIYIGDKLYTISNNTIMSSDIDTVEKIDELKF